MSDADKIAEMSQTLLKDAGFLQLFQKALNGRDIPPEGSPERDAFLKDLQSKIAEESIKDSEVVKDDEGEWMWIAPTPGFCLKCHSKDKRTKFFINICKHERVGAPVPMEDDIDDPALKDSVKVRIPISMNRGRGDFDKSGKPCKVYDCIVHPETIEKSNKDPEFRRFVAALAMSWLRQKYEPELNDEEFTNVNLKVKGPLQRQRVRLVAPKVNALNNEIRLPGQSDSGEGADKTNAKTQQKPKIEELSSTPAAAQSTLEDKPKGANFLDTLLGGSSDGPQVSHTITNDGSYDWTKHKRPTHNEYFRGDVVPETLNVEVIIPGIQSIKEVVVEVQGPQREITFTYVDQADEGGEPFYSIRLPFPVGCDPLQAKYVKKKQSLTLKLQVALPDETLLESELKLQARQDRMKEEEEERQKREKKEAELREYHERRQRIEEEEKQVLGQRKQFVEDLQSHVAGGLPKEMLEQFDTMPPEQQRTLMLRLENKKRMGDSVDDMLDKMPPEYISRITAHLRNRLGLAAPETTPPPKPEPKPEPVIEKKKKNDKEEEVEEDKEAHAPVVEHNNMKKAEKLFGVKMSNRYLWALDH